MFYCFLCPNESESTQQMKDHLEFIHQFRENIFGEAVILCMRNKACVKRFVAVRASLNHAQCEIPVNEAPDEIIPIQVDGEAVGNQDVDEDVAVGNNENVGDEEADDNIQANNLDNIYQNLRTGLDAFVSFISKSTIARTLMSIIFNQVVVLAEVLKTELLAFLSLYIDNFNETPYPQLITVFFQNASRLLLEHGTRYKHKKAMQQSPRYVAPVSRALGQRWDKVYNFNLNTYENVLKFSEFHYISIRKNIENLFEIDEFRTAYFAQQHVCRDGIYEKFCCGSIYRQSNFYRENPNAIRIQLYYDDFTLSSSSKSQPTVKLGAVYYTIENLPTYVNSHLENIHLAALFHASDLKNFGESFNRILYPIVQEILDIHENGIFVGENHYLKGNLINTSGDNLGIHIMMGMFESFSARYYCQHCKLAKNICKWAPIEVLSELRNMDEYRRTFQDRTMVYNEVPTARGLHHYSFLERVQDYSMFDNLGVDLMHDVGEGGIPDIVVKFLKKARFIKPIDEVNRAIREFKFGYQYHNDIPQSIDYSESLGLTASQKFVLFLHFPLIFEDLSRNEELVRYWPAITTLVAFTKICLSRQISNEDVVQMEYLIRTHLRQITQVYNCSLKPKQHFLTHYPNVIRRMGPPTTLWTMRYEGFHAKFKELYRLSHNTINLTKTLTERLQENRCMSVPKYGFGDWVRSKECPLSPENLINPNFIHELKFVKRMNLDIRKDSFFIIKIEDGLAEVAKVDSILVDNNNHVNLKCEMYQTAEFNNRLDCYAIDRRQNPLFVSKIDDLDINETFKAYEIGGRNYIILRKIN